MRKDERRAFTFIKNPATFPASPDPIAHQVQSTVYAALLHRRENPTAKPWSPSCPGLPAGLKIDQAFLDRELWRRQQGYGRGGTHENRARLPPTFLSGVRQGLTIGSPISVQLENRDWKNWQESYPHRRRRSPPSTSALPLPRPGHADLAGALKYNFTEARYVLERASARESAARVSLVRSPKRGPSRTRRSKS